VCEQRLANPRQTQVLSSCPSMPVQKKVCNRVVFVSTQVLPNHTTHTHTNATRFFTSLAIWPAAFAPAFAEGIACSCLVKKCECMHMSICLLIKHILCKHHPQSRAATKHKNCSPARRSRPFSRVLSRVENTWTYTAHSPVLLWLTHTSALRTV